MNEARERARKLWETSGGTKPLKEIAAELGVSEATLRSWKKRDKWGDADATQRASRKSQRNAQRNTDTNRKRQAAVNHSLVVSVEHNDNLSDVEKAFCFHFVQCFNRTQAAWRTGHYGNLNSAKDGGWRMFHNPAVQAEISRLKAMKHAALLADVDDLVELHMRIAFGDMTDFAVWGYDEKLRANRLAALPSDTIDGQLVREVSESAQGFKVKLRDTAQSMAFLERFFEANPMDQHKKEYDNKRLELEKQKQQTEVGSGLADMIVQAYAARKNGGEPDDRSN
jgi:phage terminase small subunit